MEISSYPYRSGPALIFLFSILWVITTLFMGHEALINQSSLTIDEFIHLDPSEATILIWILTAAAATLTVLSLQTLFVSLLSSHRAILTTTDISAPEYGFSLRTTVVRHSDVRSMIVQTHRGRRSLKIAHVNGAFYIRERFMPDRFSFDELCEALVKAHANATQR
jgi:hypothetical protein